MSQHARPWMALLGAAAVSLPACATTQYAPQLVARGELVLRYDGGFEMWGGGRRVARSLLYRGLEHYVRCVPEARDHARAAAHYGAAALGLSIVGGTLGVASLVGLYGLADPPNMWYWLGGGLSSAVTGTVLVGLARSYRNRANGHAVDALNYYNDRVGSLGASCDDLRYPDPAGPASPDAPSPQPSQHTP
ncbi:MAG: hypothetical protein RMK29_01015 [Myxococcales bacterium]|nr:hypothetical protein [Myxococcota bacterium]MDW8280258.1 hypothetical protein [Myxococcales bacterium]